MRTCIIFPVSFTCHWAPHKEQRLPMLSEASNSISWLTTATQKSHISDVTRLCRTRLYSMCPSLPPMHANYFWRQSGNIPYICMRTGAHRPINTLWTPTGPQMGHSCLVSVGPPLLLLQTEPEPVSFYSCSLKFQVHLKCYMLLLSRGDLTGLFFQSLLQQRSQKLLMFWSTLQ